MQLFTLQYQGSKYRNTAKDREEKPRYRKKKRKKFLNTAILNSEMKLDVMLKPIFGMLRIEQITSI